MDQTLIFFLSAIIIVGALIFGIICRTKGIKKSLDVEFYRVRYMSIENKLKKYEPSTYHISIIEADKLLDYALKESGYRGQTMSERMKNANSIFSDRNAVWRAHKLRNQIVHEPDIKATFEETRNAINGFKKALKDLRAI